MTNIFVRRGEPYDLTESYMEVDVTLWASIFHRTEEPDHRLGYWRIEDRGWYTYGCVDCDTRFLEYVRTAPPPTSG